MRVAVIAMALLLLPSGCSGPACGPGTHLEDGLCLPDDTDPTDDDDSGGDPGPLPPPGCPALPPSAGREVPIAAGDAAGLRSAVDSAEPGDVILLADGTYHLDGSYLWIDVDDVVLRSQSGDRDAVVLDGAYLTTEIVNVVGSRITVADITLKRSRDCAIHVQPADGRDIEGALIYNVAVVDPGQHAIKLNSVGGHYADRGVVACTRQELTSEGRPHVSNCYTGGIDFHRSRGWHIYDNHIEGFWCPSGLPEHAIHLWNGNADSLVERNTIVNVARGIGLGMNPVGTDERGFAADYECAEGSAPDDFHGTVRNNVIVADDPDLFASGSGFDVGIELENTCDSRLLHNTVFSTAPPYSSMSWRYPGTSAHVANNLLSHNLRPRDVADVIPEGNIESAGAAHFADAGARDLHLASGSSAVDAGVQLSGDSTVPHDIDGDPRDAAPDVGADER